MYFASVVLLSLVLPVASAFVEQRFFHGASLGELFVKWFVFWAAGARLAIAGLRQQLRPRMTSEGIFGIKSDDPLPFVRELGVANLAGGVVALMSVVRPDFLLPACVSSTVFYLLAAFWHATHPHRSFNQNVAMVSDVILGVMFGALVVIGFMNTGIDIVTGR